MTASLVSTLSRSLLIVCFGAVCASGAAAQLTEKKAVAQVRSTTKTQLSAFKGTGKAALATLNANLAFIEGTLADTSNVNTITFQIANSTASFATTVSDAFRQSFSIVNGAASNGLHALADGGNLLGIYPLAFYSGTRGLTDKAQTQLLAAARQLETRALNRLTKTRKLAETKAGIGVTVTLRLPTDSADTATNQGTMNSMALGARIDVLVGGSRLGLPSDGILVVAGFAGNSLITVDCTASGAGFDTESILPDASSGRFLTYFDNGGNGLPEGNYVVAVAQGGSPFLSSAPIGLR